MNHAIDTDDVDLALRLLRNDPGPGQTGYELRVSVEAIHLPGAAEHPLYPYALGLAALFAAFRETASPPRISVTTRWPRCDVSSPSSDLAVELVVSNCREASRSRSARCTTRASTGNVPSTSPGPPVGALGSRRTWEPPRCIHAMAEDPDTAIPLAEEGLALARQIGQPTAIVMNLAALAAALAIETPNGPERCCVRASRFGRRSAMSRPSRSPKPCSSLPASETGPSPSSSRRALPRSPLARRPAPVRGDPQRRRSRHLRLPRARDRGRPPGRGAGSPRWDRRRCCDGGHRRARSGRAVRAAVERPQLRHPAAKTDHGHAQRHPRRGPCTRTAR